MFAITDTKHYVQMVNWLTQDNRKLLKKIKLGLKRAINWNIFQSKVSTQA